VRRFATVLALAAALPAQAELKPEWELGAGATAFSLPDYRGSDESRVYGVPFPYVIYHGERLRVDRQGVRGMFFESDRVELDLSMNATPPVDEKNRAREGMPHLDPTFEIGPRLNFILLRDRPNERALTLRLPVRAVVATDLSDARWAGFTAYPHLSADLRSGGWNVGVQAGPLFGTGRYHEYFYSVEPHFATAERPAYDARSGYSGALALASITRRFDKMWIGAFARYDTLKGAAFESSPLVKRDHALMWGIALAWVFTESAHQVEVDVED
jgi:outer membrane scaffolding protein for murein synthesis (MipA/OmpV family)